MTALLVSSVRSDLAALEARGRLEHGDALDTLAVLGAAIAAGEPASTSRWTAEAALVTRQPHRVAQLTQAIGGLARIESEGEPDLVEVLRLRTRIELARLALEAIDPALALHEEDAIGTAELDNLLETEMWRCTAHNDERARMALSIGEPFCGRFPWLFRGLAVDATASGSLGAVASLLAAFPSARDALEALIEGEHLLRDEPRSGARDTATDLGGSPERGLERSVVGDAPVIDLAEARKKQQRGRVLELVAGVRVAAAGDPVLRDPYCDAPIVFEDEQVEVRAIGLEDGLGVRVIVWGDESGGLDERGAVRFFDAGGGELRPTGGQALPTLWWGRFQGATPTTLRLASPARQISV